MRRDKQPFLLTDAMAKKTLPKSNLATGKSYKFYQSDVLLSLIL